MLRILLILGSFLALVFAAHGPALFAQNSTQSGGSTEATRSAVSDPAALFEDGERALAKGEYKRAEQAFRAVIDLDPRSFAAYANLGVVYMREKKWDAAVSMLHKAEKLNPGAAGIRLNLGLAYYRQGEFQEAIPAFVSVAQSDQTSAQARYLLGLCYFFTKDYANAASTLQPLESVEWNDLNFLYVLGISAWQAKQP